MIIVWTQDMYKHEDVLSGLNKKLPLNEKLQIIHLAVATRFPFIHRVAVALYDSKSNVLKTFISSSGADAPLVRYECALSDAPSLVEILSTRRPRVVNDLSIFQNGEHDHTKRIHEQGYGSSYTAPILSGDVLWGFVFFNSYERDCFTEQNLPDFDLFSHLISSIVVQEISAIRVLLAALKTTSDLVHERDSETGSHLDRISRFARIIAQELATSGKYKFNDEYIERIFLFSPLHDVGKIGIPDSILRKAGRLEMSEFELMKEHTIIGYNIINTLVENFGFHSFEGIDILRNIAKYHHEKVDGTGYPGGLKAEEIPPEARIVAVADIFDALTSRRRYKRAWTNEEAFEMLQKMSQTQLDAECVEALIKNKERIEEVQLRFEEEFGRA